MTDASWPLQVAIYEAVKVALNPVHVADFIRGDKKMPYFVVGETTVIDDSDKTGNGQEHSVHIHGFSQSEGRKFLKQEFAKIYAALHQQNIEIDGHDTVTCTFDWASSIDLDEDNKTYHGIVRYKIITYSNT